MAQKKRGLGRGLQALIPETQAENPAQRPSDVFFPRVQVAAAGDELLSVRGEGDAASAHAAEIVSTLLAPSKRMAGGRKTKAPRRDKTSGEEVEATTSVPVPQGDVSRETSSVVPRNLDRVTDDPMSQSLPGSHRSEPGHSEAIGSDQEVVSRLPMAAQSVPAPRDRAAVGERDQTEAVEAGDADVSRETSQAVQDLVPVPGTTFAELPIELIGPNPRQPRQVFDEEEIGELAASIREVGLLQPIVVRRAVNGHDASRASSEPDTYGILDGPVTASATGSHTSPAAANAQRATAESATSVRYELIMGERRLRAAKAAGLEAIPALVRYTEDDDLLRDALLENLHRVELNPLEEAAAYQQLLEDFGCTQSELSQKIARSRSQISNTLRLMKLPALVQRRVAAGVLSAGHARALLGLPDVAAMERVAQRIVAEGLSVRATEEIVAVYDEPDVESGKKAPGRAKVQALPRLSGRLSDVFDTRVKVTRGAKKGKITIEFAGEDDLARIVSALAPGTSIEE